MAYLVGVQVTMIYTILTLCSKRRVYERFALHEFLEKRQFRDSCCRMPGRNVQDRCGEREHCSGGNSANNLLLALN